MNLNRFEQIVSRYRDLKVVLVGDICLDRYLHIDPALRETSIETGLEVRNVVAVRPQAGGGGTVLANLAALCPASLTPVSFAGRDGEGYELRRCLEELGADMRHFISTPHRMTFTYTKPLLMHPGRPPEELSRIDIRSRSETPRELQDWVADHLAQAVAEADVVVAMEQVPQRQTGVLTLAVKRALAELAQQNPAKVFIADSRCAIDEFSQVRIKVNRSELLRHFGAAEDAAADVAALARRWSADLGQDVFVTIGPNGILAAGADGVRLAPGVPVAPPIDIVGAGDAVLAGIAMALAAGASAYEAAEMGNLAGSVVVKKIGTTGTASVEELRRSAQALGRGSTGL